MKNKKHIQNEIFKLKKIMSLKSSSEQERERAWYCMLSLQWLFLKDKTNLITPANLCCPRLFRNKSRNQNDK